MSNVPKRSKRTGDWLFELDAVEHYERGGVPMCRVRVLGRFRDGPPVFTHMEAARTLDEAWERAVAYLEGVLT